MSQDWHEMYLSMFKKVLMWQFMKAFSLVPLPLGIYKYARTNFSEYLKMLSATAGRYTCTLRKALAVPAPRG